MKISTQIYCGDHDGEDGATTSPYRVTCRLVTRRGGLESMHLNGWVRVAGTEVELLVLDITSPHETLHGRERAITMSHVARLCATAP